MLIEGKWPSQLNSNTFERQRMTTTFPNIFECWYLELHSILKLLKFDSRFLRYDPATGKTTGIVLGATGMITGKNQQPKNIISILKTQSFSQFKKDFQEKIRKRTQYHKSENHLHTTDTKCATSVYTKCNRQVKSYQPK